jgi:membrane protein YqaA with SNARE-associated domain
MFDNIPGFTEISYEKIRNLYANWDFWILFVSAALPLPFKIFSISSGVFNINLLIFVIATFLSQGIKFGLLAFLTLKLGPRVKKLFDYNWKPIILIASATIAIMILMMRVF